ncbi:MAG: lytic transglycosylase domain-containing protein [Anaerovoracaceae bacterium]|jgi:hypothetical protein
MAKKLVSVWLSLTILLFSSVSIYAYADSGVVQGDYLLKDVVINGENIVNYKLSDPIVSYNNYIYVPLDETMGQILGISAAMDTESRTVYITPTTPQAVDFGSRQIANNLDNLSMTADYSAKVCVVSNNNGQQQVTYLDLTNCPVLVKDSIVYVPINAIVSSGGLGWSLYWDGYSGATISTQSGISAASYFNAADSAYKAGLTAYIMKKNPSISLYKAQTMMEYFRNYSEMYGIDEELMMAMAECESTFNTDIVNSHGCYGLMQIKASTGAIYGYSASDLLQMKPAIRTSVLIMRTNLDLFGGNVTKAVSAYNYGEYAVLRGTYKLGYYNKVVKKLYSIISYASSYSL